MMQFTIESLRAGDEEQRMALGRQAFGGTMTYDPEAPRFPPDRVVAAYAGDHLVGAVVTHEFSMYWGGEGVPCGGVAGVVVAPEARGNDLARRMLRESFDRMLARGEVLSALYPTTATLYRGAGYEVAGWWRQSGVGIDHLPVGAADALDWRTVDFDDPALGAVMRRMAPSHDGWLHHSELWWRWRAHRARADASTNRYAYVGSDSGEDVAASIFHQRSSDRGLYDLQTDLVAGVDGRAVAAVLGLLGRHGTTVHEVVTTLPPHVLGLHVPHPQHLRPDGQWAWMVRLVDMPTCMRLRGFPPGVRGRVHLDVRDPFLPANDGPAVFDLDDGVVGWESGGPGTVEVTVQDLAALYAGADPRVLAAAGRLPGATPTDLGFLRAAFSAAPSAVDFF